MNTEELIVEARAKITWGDEPSSVRDFLTSNGMSRSDADAKLKDLILERNEEIRGMGILDLVIGGVLTGGTALFFYLASDSLSTATSRRGVIQGCGFIGAVGIYGCWRLIKGGFRLFWPKSEDGSLADD